MNRTTETYTIRWDRVLTLAYAVVGAVMSVLSIVVIGYLTDQNRPSLLPWAFLIQGVLLVFAAMERDEEEVRQGYVPSARPRPVNRQWQAHRATGSATAGQNPSLDAPSSP